MGMENMFGPVFRTKQPTRRTVEAGGAGDGGLAALGHGLTAGTRVASNLGWRAIDALAVGDKVLTFDHGMQEITEIRRAHVWLDAPETAEALWPVVVPEGVLGNREELVLLPDQGVMVESDAAQDIHGDPFAILTALSLEGYRGIHRRQPLQRIELIAVYFADEEVIYAEGGALIHCVQKLARLDRFIEAGATARYHVLGGEDAEKLVDHICMEDRILAATNGTQARAASYA